MRFLLSLILTLTLCFPAYADIEWARKRVFDLSGGLNDTFAADIIAENEVADIQNMILDTTGNLKTRSGFAKLNTSTVGSSVACIGVFYYKQADGTRFLVAVFDDDTIRKMDYGSGTSGPDGTWDDITGGLSFAAGANTVVSFTVGENILIIDDGINTTAPYKWTGSGNAAALGGSPPTATMVAYHKRHAFAAGKSTALSTLFFTDLDDIENWTTGLSGSILVETNDGSIIRALIPGIDALYIFKDSTIWRLTGSDKDSFKLQRMVADLGTLVSSAVGLIGSNMIFVSDQGEIFLYDGAIKVRKISAKIEASLDAANFDRFQYTKATVFQDDFYFTFSTGSTSTFDRLMIFDSFHNAWTKFKGLNVNAMTVADDGGGEDILVFGDYTGFVYKYPSGTNDAGTAIDDFFLTKQYRFDELRIKKTLRRLDVYATAKSNYNLDVETRSNFQSTGDLTLVDLEASGSLYGTAIYGSDTYGGENLIVGEIEPNLEGRFFQIRFGNSNKDEPIEVKGYDMYVEQSDRL